jgi:hypothetical protein
MTKQTPKSFVLMLAFVMLSAVSKGQDSSAESSDATISVSKPATSDFNTDIYYKNKLEFSLETGALPINIPFVFDVFVGGDYSQKPLHYTLVPIFPSLRWHMGKISGPWILRGNTDLTASLSLTAIPRGPEKVYGAFDLGVWRNFVHRNWRTAPTLSFARAPGSSTRKGQTEWNGLKGRISLLLSG